MPNWPQPSVGGVLLLIAALVSGCIHSPEGVPLSPRDERLWGMYQTAISDALVTAPDERLPLVPLTTDPVSVVTWSLVSSRYTNRDTIPMEGEDRWVTVVPEVQERCRQFPREGLHLRLQQLLGLPPDTMPRQFVVLSVSQQDLFRPCPDPDPTTTHCPLSFPDRVPADHVQWFDAWMHQAY
ncbi:MAG: hypothetical protein ACREI3_09990, partial [Nitrospirales bacterium]